MAERDINEVVQDRLTPMLQRNQHSSYIIPRRTETNDFSPKLEETEKDDEVSSAHEVYLPIEEPEPNFNPQLEPVQTATAAEQSEENGSTQPPTASPAERSRTAPAAARRRPKAGSRTSTLLAGMTRRATGMQANEKNPGEQYTYSYSFAPDPADSDSSSSSDDDVPTPSPLEKKPPPFKAPEEQAGEEPTEENKKQRRRYQYSRFMIGNDFLKTKGRVSRNDGRLKISINETANSGYVAKALGQSIRNHLDIPLKDKKKRESKQKKADEVDQEDAKSIASSFRTKANRPRLNIVIMVIGSRGDIQPFLKIGKILRQDYGHRVRIASHPVFREFVEQDAGLEFFSVGGDPSELMAFMVKNPGLIPSMSTIREGEISRRRDGMAEMFEGFWRACINTTDDETDRANQNMMGTMPPFVADAIIANPPSMAHVHIAERLGIPLHMMFTFPYTPTTQFPHPLANIKPRKSNVDAGYVNFMSYPLVEMMTWQGLGDIVNRFRENTLHLEPVSSLWAPGALYRMKVPYTYLWSPSLVPKPKDWGPEVDIGGFVFLNLASRFTPPQDLMDFLNAGPPPVYIGFGSIVLDDPDKFTEMIFKATELAGVRALVNKGWGGFGRSNENTPKHIFMLGNTPHDWLFPRVSAVVHHGGAGTTAIGLKSGKPTMIVPFFGDQPFWGSMVAEAKAGAYQCIPYKKLTLDRMVEGIKQCLTKEAQENVQTIADSIAKEGDGANNAVKSFHRSLPLAGRHSMRCSLLTDRVAVWKVRASSLRLSALAAEILHQKGKFRWSELKMIRHYAWNDFDGPGEPVTGSVEAMAGSLYGIGEGFGMVPIRIARHIRKREEHERRKRARQKKMESREGKKSEETPAKQKQIPQKQAHLTDYAHDTRRAETGLNVEPQTSITRSNTQDTTSSTISADPAEPLPREVLDDLNWGLKRAGSAILTMPNDLHVAIAQGFHNAPRLWGDATVRKPIRIKGVKSGWTAARKEFAYGIYDGWTGLVKQPKGDWQDADTMASKLAGLGTGIGKGLGGFVLKNTNALVAPLAFTMKGLIKHVEKHHDGPGSKPFLRKAHILQGEIDLHTLEDQKDEEGIAQLQAVREQVEHGWKVYEDIWAHAHEEFGPVGGNVVGKHKMKREKKLWDVNGALENVNTANEALNTKANGQDLGQLFARRRKEMQEAEEPRAPAMDEPDSPVEQRQNVLKFGSSLPRLEKPDDKCASSSPADAKAEGLTNVPEEDSSETTAVATPEGEAGGEDESGDRHAALGKIGEGMAANRPSGEVSGAVDV